MTRDYCDGIDRRGFVSAGLTGLAGLSLPTLLQMQAQAATPKQRNSAVIFPTQCGTARKPIRANARIGPRPLPR